MDEQIKKSAAELLAELEPRTRKFVLSFRKLGRKRLSAIDAGFSEKSAAVQASRLLRREDVKAAIHALAKEDCENLCISKDSLIVEAYEILQKCKAEVPVKRYNAETKEWEEIGEYNFDSKGCGKMLDVLLRAIGADTKKVEVTPGEGFEIKVSVIE